MPKGKLFEKSMKLDMPYFSIIETPMNDKILNDKFYHCKDNDAADTSILQQISNNRGSMIDMFAVANHLSMMHLKASDLPEPSASISTEKKALKRKKGKEEFEMHLWKTLTKAIDIKEKTLKKKMNKALLKKLALGKKPLGDESKPLSANSPGCGTINQSTVSGIEEALSDSTSEYSTDEDEE